jgi:methylmalonyl-CoA mutase N-terminal domain/subunit
VDVVDPFGGSYFVERLTSDLEREALEYFARIDAMGGMIEAIEQGYPQREIADSAYQFQQAVELRDRIIVGVNDFVTDGEPPVGTLYIDESAGEKQLAKLNALRRQRDQGRVDSTLDALRRGAAGADNTMQLLIDAVRAYATVGEMCDALRAVWGEYVEEAVI